MTLACFGLIPSPLLGPYSWSLVGAALEQRGHRVIIPTLSDDGGVNEPYWVQHARSAAAALADAPDTTLILVGHSGAGLLLPAIREATGHPVQAYLFVDAGIPHGPGRSQPRLDPDVEADRELLERIATDGVFPKWNAELLEPILPDLTMREVLIAELRPRPLAYWQEALPVFDGWPDAPCAYLQFSLAYDRDAERARLRGWRFRLLAGGHFDLLARAEQVAEALINLAGESPG